MDTRRVASCLLPLALLLASCSEERPKPAESVKPEAARPEAPPEPVTGRTAFHQMYLAARAWARDAEPLRLASLNLSEVPSQPGKAGAWEATFASAERRQAKRFTYSVVESSGNLHKGVFAGPEEAYTGPTTQRKPFLIPAFKTDSDQAFELAAKHAEAYIKKHPDTPVNYLVENSNRFPNPTWRVFWGQSVGTSGFYVFVDLTTGQFLQKMR